MINHRSKPDADRVRFWLREARDADALIELASAFNEFAVGVTADRPLLSSALDRDRDRLELELAQEQIRGKQADREYWSAPSR